MRSKDLLPMLLFPSTMVLKFVSDFFSKSCNVLSNNQTGSSYFPCSSVCYYIILISFLADLCLGQICSHMGFFGFTKDICRKKIRACSFAYKKTFFLMMKMLFKVKKADSILTCARMCSREAACKEASFLVNKGTRSLFDEGQQARKLKRFIKRDGSFYIEKVLLEFCRFFRLM